MLGGFVVLSPKLSRFTYPANGRARQSVRRFFAARVRAERDRSNGGSEIDARV
jgi:hypothetical protein